MDNITVNDFMETDLGPVSPDPRGPYDNTATYEHLSLVELGGGSYLCTIAPGEVITGIAPEPGKTTEYWQVLTIPGDLTPEYIAMHDRVQNAVKQTELDRAATELSEQNVSGMETNVEQMQADVQAGAAQVARDKDSAAGYAQAAEVSRQAAGTSEQNVAALVNGFDSHVQEKTTEATGTIETARQQAVSVVQQQGAESAQGVIDDTEAYFDEKKAAALSEISDKTTEIVKLVTDEGTKQIGLVDAAGAAQVSAIEQEGTDQIANIQMEAESYIKREDANKLAFKGESEGRSHHVEDSADWGFLGMQGYGESTQVQTTGAQLIAHPFDESTLTRNGITYTDNGDGSVIVNGTATTDSVTYIKFGKTLEAGTYTLSGCPAGGSANGYSLCFGSSLQADIGEGITRDVNNETFDIYIRVKSGTTVNNAVFRPMLNAGDTALPWEPYTGGAPSPSTDYPQEIESKCQARQLLDESTLVQGMIHGVTGNNDGSSKFVSTDFIPVTPGDYIISGINITPHFNVVVPYDANKNILPDQTISVPRATGIFTVPEGVAYIRIRFNSATGITDPITPDELRSKKPMLNAGTTPGAWAPYGKYGLETIFTGAQLYDVTDFASGSKWIGGDDGYITITIDNKAGASVAYGTYDVRPSQLIKTGKEYLCVCEIKSVSGTGVFFAVTSSEATSKGQFVQNFIPNFSIGTYASIITARDSFDDVNAMLRTVLSAPAGASASITFRLSIMEDLRITPQTFVYQAYATETLHTYLDTPLRGIPVSSGGNVTIDGQEHIADYRDWERGKHIQRVRELVLDGSESYTLQSINDNGIANFVYTLPAEGAIIRGVLKNLCNMFRWDSNGIANVSEECYFNDATKVYFRIKSSTASTVEEFKAFVAQNNIQLQYVLAEPIETDIPPEELAAYRRLHTYHGTTNIHNSDDVYTAVEYARDPDTYLNNKLAEISAAIIGG